MATTSHQRSVLERQSDFDSMETIWDHLRFTLCVFQTFFYCLRLNVVKSKVAHSKFCLFQNPEVKLLQREDPEEGDAERTKRNFVYRATT